MTNETTTKTQDGSNGRSTSDSGRSSGAFLWSGMRPKNDFPFWMRVVLLPLYLASRAYHCLRGTPVYIQYGNHELRYDDAGTTHGDTE